MIVLSSQNNASTVQDTLKDGSAGDLLQLRNAKTTSDTSTSSSSSKDTSSSGDVLGLGTSQLTDTLRSISANNNTGNNNGGGGTTIVTVPVPTTTTSTPTTNTGTGTGTNTGTGTGTNTGSTTPKNTHGTNNQPSSNDQNYVSPNQTLTNVNVSSELDFASSTQVFKLGESIGFRFIGNKSYEAYQWDFDSDGNIDATGSTATFTPPIFKSYNVSLIVTVSNTLKNKITKTNFINPQYDLKEYWPNTSISNSSLIVNQSGTSLLWFESIDESEFRMYDTSPVSTDPKYKCHYDVFNWDNNIMSYEKTVNNCNGNTRSEIVYTNPIRLLNRYWNRGEESMIAGRTDMNYLENGQRVCQGEMEYSSIIKAVEAGDEYGEELLHVKVYQKFTITSSQNGDCTVGEVTEWEEHYVLSSKINHINKGTFYKGIIQTYGGNLDNVNNYGTWEWNDTFKYWLNF